MQIIPERRIELPTRSTEVKIVALGCIHHGAAGCREDLADFWYDYILKTPNTYCILGGDLVDAIFETDKRYANEEVADWCRKRKNPEWELIDVQYHYALEKWKPLAKAGKILWLLAGNHELTIKKRHSRNLSAAWANELKVPYAGIAALANVVLTCKGSSYTVSFYTTHGGGGAQSDGAVMNRVASMLSQYDVDVALMWHLHRRMHILKRRMGLTETRHGKVPKLRPRDSIAAVCGTFLDGHREGILGYGEVKQFQPVAPGPAVIHLRVMESSREKEVAKFVRIWVSDAIVEQREED